MHILRIPELELHASLGVHDWEHRHRQTLMAEVELSYDATAAVHEDSLCKAIDYVSLCNQLQRVAGQRHYELLETLASALLETMVSLPSVASARVSLQKGGCLPHARAVVIEVRYP